MPATRRASLLIGLGMFFSFLGVLALIFSPVFGGRNGLQYADDLFNKLTKGSAYFIPALNGECEKCVGKTFRVTIQMDKTQEAERAQKLLTSAGARVEAEGGKLTIVGDLGRILQSILRDSDHMFKNDGQKVASAYGSDPQEVMRSWWTALTRMEKSFKRNLQIEESKLVAEVVKKGVEPAYNFYRVEGQRVADRAGVMSFLLVFYVVYTLWWGYAIFYLFEGLGLSMKKAKVKKEN